MKYVEFMEKNSFELVDLLALAYGRIVDDPPPGFDARLPTPPLLMMDRILSVTRDKSQGAIVAEQDIRLDAWYFQCHMPGDPVQPGCLCVDAVWQLLGFYCAWRGAVGTGRALGCGEVLFNGQIRPYNNIARYEIAVKRYTHLKESGTSIVIGEANIFVDGELIMVMKDARTGVFKGIAYPDYPMRSRNSIGGMLR